MFLFVYSFQVKYHRLLKISIHSCTCASFFIFSQRLLYKSLSFLKWFHEAISLWWLFMGSVTLWWWLKLLLQILFLFFNSFKLIWERERERNIDLLFHPFMHSLVYSPMCPDRGSNPQCWHTGTMLLPTDLSGQGSSFSMELIFLHLLFIL